VCVANISAKKGNNIVKKVDVVKAKDKQAINVVINYKDGKKVINNSKEVFNTFDNNKDKDYKKSNKNKNTVNKNKGGLGISKVNSSNNKKGLSKVNISKSNNKDCIKTGDNSRKVSVIRGDKNISEKESC
jgi:homoaconitase/3-isopropylmalate dehydratase large subunit